MNLRKFDISGLAFCGKYEKDHESKISTGQLVYKKSTNSSSNGLLLDSDINMVSCNAGLFQNKVALYIDDLAIEISDNSSSDDDSSSSSSNSICSSSGSSCSISLSDDSNLSLLDSDDTDTEVNETDDAVAQIVSNATTSLQVVILNGNDIDSDTDNVDVIINNRVRSILVNTSISAVHKRRNTKNVQFSHVRIQEYAVTVGTIGCFQSDKVILCPLQLCWEHTSEKCYPIDSYETKRYKNIVPVQRKTSSLKYKSHNKNKHTSKRSTSSSTRAQTAALALAKQKSIFDMSEMFDYLSEEVVTCQLQQANLSSSSHSHRSTDDDIAIITNSNNVVRSLSLPCPKRLSLKERRKRIAAVQMISVDQVKVIDKLQRQIQLQRQIRTQNNKTTTITTNSSSSTKSFMGDDDDDKNSLLLLPTSALAKASTAIQQWYYCSI